MLALPVEVQDPADNEVVVTGRVDGFDLAVDPGHRPVEDGATRPGAVPFEALELVTARYRKRLADIQLMLAEHVDAERTGRPYLRPALRRPAREEAHEDG